MREIKYRAYVQEKVGGIGWMGEVISLKWALGTVDGAYVQDREHATAFFRCYQFILMQFTGLLDENGKEIYEGDIVKIDSGVEELSTARIDYRGGQFVAQSLTTKKFCSLSMWNAFNSDSVAYVEVIGNIYENPEKLER